MLERKQIATADTFEAAKAYALEAFDVLDMDDDTDHENCADFITRTLEVYAIQPIGFTLGAEVAA